MAQPALPAVDRRAFLKTVAATAGTVAGGPLLAACAPAAAPLPLAGADPLAGATPPAGVAGTAPAPTPAGSAASTRAGAATLKLGVLLPGSGPYAALGESMLRGMQLYLESVGHQAGGRPIELAREDEGATGDEAVRKARKLLESDGVALIVGIVGTPVAHAVRDLIHETKTILLVMGAGGNALTRARKSPYLFRTSFTSWQVSYPLGEWVAKNVARRVYLSAADHASGRESALAFKDSFTRQGGTVVGESYAPSGSTDYGPYLAEIAQARPEAIYAFYSGADAVHFVQQYAALGLSRDVRLTGAGFLTEQDVLPAQGRAAEGAITSLFWALTLDNPENRRFTQAYRQRFGRDADAFALQAYDAAHVLVEALNQTGGDTADKGKLVDAIAGVQLRSPRGPLRFDRDTHQVIQDIYIREVKDQRGTLNNVVLDRFKDVRDTV